MKHFLCKTVAVASSVFLLLLALPHVSVAAPSPDANRETYATGRKYLGAGKWLKAIEIFTPLAGNYPLLADYILWDLAVCHEKSGNVEGSLAAFRNIIAHHKNSPLYRKAYQKILELGKKNDISVQLADFDSYLKEFPQDSKIAWEKAALLEKSGRMDEAIALRKEIFVAGGSHSMNAYEELKKSNIQPAAADAKKALVRLLENGNYGQAVSLTEGISLKDDEIRLMQARAYYRLRRYSDAIKTLSGVALLEAKSLLAQSLVRTKENELYYKLVADQVAAGRKDFFNLHLLAAEMKRREGDYQSAATMLQAMNNLYPDKREDIAWAQAWLNIRQKRFADAEKILAELAASGSEKRDKFLFWQGKVRKYQGQNGDALFAQIKDKNGYYWLQSGAGKPGTPTGQGRVELKKDGVPLPPEEMQTRFLRITALYSLAMRAEARTEARLLASSVADPYTVSFAQLLVTIEDYLSLVRLGARANYPLWRYPLAFQDIVAKQARAHNIDPLLIMAIMREESLFQRDIVSSAGALGIMQLMPATARTLAAIKNNEELFDPEKNIRLGTMYFNKLLLQFKFTHYAIAAYNAGPHNVERWIAQGYQDEDEFTEDIPFGETKAYVIRIMQSLGIMKGLYAKDLKSS